MVSCTGSQFCGFALAETKARATQLMEALEQELHIPGPVRVHFTGCPNSCGQAQVRIAEGHGTGVRVRCRAEGQGH